MPVDAAKIEAILAFVEAGESERAACEQVGISRSTFRSAVLRFSMADQYARATEALARDQVEKLEVTIQDMRDGKLPADQARIEIDARKWIASKLFKPTWGDKQTLEHSGPNGSPIQVEASVDISLALKGLPDEDLEALERIAGKLAGPKE